MPPSDRERRIARRRAEIVEADMRTLLDGGRVNWARQTLDVDVRLSGPLTLTQTTVDTVRGRHTESTVRNISVSLPIGQSTRVDTIRASGVDSVRTTSNVNVLGVTVETIHTKPAKK